MDSIIPSNILEDYEADNEGKKDYVYLTSEEFTGDLVLKVNVTKGLVVPTRTGGMTTKACIDVDIVEHTPDGHYAQESQGSFSGAQILIEPSNNRNIDRIMQFLGALKQASPRSLSPGDTIPEYFATKGKGKSKEPVECHFEDEAYVGCTISANPTDRLTFFNPSFYAVTKSKDGSFSKTPRTKLK